MNTYRGTVCFDQIDWTLPENAAEPNWPKPNWDLLTPVYVVDLRDSQPSTVEKVAKQIQMLPATAMTVLQWGEADYAFEGFICTMEAAEINTSRPEDHDYIAAASNEDTGHRASIKSGFLLDAMDDVDTDEIYEVLKDMAPWTVIVMQEGWYDMDALTVTTAGDIVAKLTETGDDPELAY